MGKSKIQPMSELTLPKAPFLYINDPTIGARIASKLTELIPKVVHIASPQLSPSAAALLSRKHVKLDDVVYLWTSNLADKNDTEQKEIAKRARQAAILHSRNSATVNIRFDESAAVTAWGGNHLDLVMSGTPDSISASEIKSKAESIYRWLFTVLSVKETLHLIPDEQMRVLDSSTAFKDAEYCAIGNNRNISKDAKVQFVALVVSKPTIVSGNRLVWQVADKTGVANFYFKYRGPSSQYTWDWVLNLEPGQRKCLPRMPCVLVKEKFHIALLKAPIRMPAAMIQGTGQAIKLVGHGLVKAGKAMSMGKRKKWVPQADVAAYLKKHGELQVVPPTTVKKTTIPIFTENGHRAWSDTDSSRSTLKDLVMDEKAALVAKEALL